MPSRSIPFGATVIRARPLVAALILSAVCGDAAMISSGKADGEPFQKPRHKTDAP